MFLPPAGGPESGFLKCTGLTCKNVIPTEGRKHFFKNRVKIIASGGKRATKVGVGECYAYVGGSGGVIKSPKGCMVGEKVAKRMPLWRTSS